MGRGKKNTSVVQFTDYELAEGNCGLTRSDVRVTPFGDRISYRDIEYPTDKHNQTI